MQTTMIRAGRYEVLARAGKFTVKNPATKTWLVLNDRNRLVHKCETLRDAKNWISSLDNRPASVKSKNYLRSLLEVQADTLLAGKIRSYFNELRQQGREIDQAEVSLAIHRLLEAQGRAPKLPTQKRADSIAQARQAITTAKAARV